MRKASQAAERLYLLANLLYEPDLATCQAAVTEFGLAVAPEEILRAYWQTFVNPVGPRLRPVESLFKPWTTFADCQLPLARQKGWLGGDSAAHLRSLYAALGLEVPPGLAHTPDHLALELTLLGLLLEHGTPEMRATFRSQHLDWLPDLQARAAELDVPAVYQQVLELCARAVAPEE